MILQKDRRDLRDGETTEADLAGTEPPDLTSTHDYGLNEPLAETLRMKLLVAPESDHDVRPPYRQHQRVASLRELFSDDALVRRDLSRHPQPLRYP